MKSITIRLSIIICLIIMSGLSLISAEEAKKETSKQNLRNSEINAQVNVAQFALPPQYTKSPEIDLNRKISGNNNEAKFQNVTYVAEISAAGKASLELQNSGDKEYIKLIENGFESPTFNSKIMENRPTPVEKAANINYLWMSNNPGDKNLWQNVEFNRYNNRLLDTSRYFTPAHFNMNEVGNTVVHAPSNHGLQITAPTTTTLTTSNTFLDVEDVDMLIDMEEFEGLDETQIENSINDKMNNYYSFLK